MVKLEKCQFGVSQIEFLGHIVDATGIKPLPKKVEAIKDFTLPNNVKGLERFLGMVNFYHSFIPHAAKIVQPLYQALSGRPRPKTLVWSG